MCTMLVLFFIYYVSLVNLIYEIVVVHKCVNETRFNNIHYDKEIVFFLRGTR